MVTTTVDDENPERIFHLVFPLLPIERQLSERKMAMM